MNSLAIRAVAVTVAVVAVVVALPTLVKVVLVGGAVYAFLDANNLANR